MKTEHTPGPWTIQHRHSPRVYLINDRHDHAIGEVVYSDTRNPLDAQLIAAAPDLLRALVDLLDDQRDASLPVLDRARAAVYKAIGA